VRAILDRHRLTLARQSYREPILAIAHLVGEHVDIAAHAVMDNDANLREGIAVGNAAERDGVGAASLDVSFMAISSLRVHGALVDAGHIGDIALTQVVRISCSHCDTHCYSRDTGGPYTFASICFHTC